jgi:DNA-binding transcriptional ArsR family regulator
MKESATAQPAGASYGRRERAESAGKAIPGVEILRGLGETFKVLGDVTRLKICFALARHELCVGELAGVVRMSESAVSHQLRIMKAMRLVKYRREGKMTYYMLDDLHINDLIRIGIRHVTEL